jgi:hypothetical protein
MLMYAQHSHLLAPRFVCVVLRMLTYADVCRRMLMYAQHSHLLTPRFELVPLFRDGI